MFVPDPTDQPGWIILVPCQPQLPLLPNDIEYLTCSVGEVWISGLTSTLIDIEFVDGGREEQDIGGARPTHGLGGLSTGGVRERHGRGEQAGEAVTR